LKITNTGVIKANILIPRGSGIANSDSTELLKGIDHQESVSDFVLLRYTPGVQNF